MDIRKVRVTIPHFTNYVRGSPKPIFMMRSFIVDEYYNYNHDTDSHSDGMNSTMRYYLNSNYIVRVGRLCKLPEHLIKPLTDKTIGVGITSVIEPGASNYQQFHMSRGTGIIKCSFLEDRDGTGPVWRRLYTHFHDTPFVKFNKRFCEVLSDVETLVIEVDKQ